MKKRLIPWNLAPLDHWREPFEPNHAAPSPSISATTYHVCVKCGAQFVAWKCDVCGTTRKADA